MREFWLSYIIILIVSFQCVFESFIFSGHFLELQYSLFILIFCFDLLLNSFLSSVEQIFSYVQSFIY